MLDPTVVLWIRRLLEEGLDRSEVTHITGVSSAWILFIACGLWSDDLREQEGLQHRWPERTPRRCPAYGLPLGRICESCRIRSCMLHGAPGALLPDGFQHPLHALRRRTTRPA